MMHLISLRKFIVIQPLARLHKVRRTEKQILCSRSFDQITIIRSITRNTSLTVAFDPAHNINGTIEWLMTALKSSEHDVCVSDAIDHHEATEMVRDAQNCNKNVLWIHPNGSNRPTVWSHYHMVVLQIAVKIRLMSWHVLFIVCLFSVRMQIVPVLEGFLESTLKCAAGGANH